MRMSRATRGTRKPDTKPSMVKFKFTKLVMVYDCGDVLTAHVPVEKWDEFLARETWESFCFPALQ